MDQLAVALLGFLTGGIGAVGGLGGAVILVPILVLTGMPVADAAPLGLVSVAAGSISAAAVQLRGRTVNHRLGVATETAATAGALGSALVSGALGERELTYSLAAVALVAAFMGGRRKGVRNVPEPALGPGDIGERAGTLAGAYPLNGSVVAVALGSVLGARFGAHVQDRLTPPFVRRALSVTLVAVAVALLVSA